MPNGGRALQSRTTNPLKISNHEDHNGHKVSKHKVLWMNASSLWVGTSVSRNALYHGSLLCDLCGLCGIPCVFSSLRFPRDRHRHSAASDPKRCRYSNV